MPWRSVREGNSSQKEPNSLLRFHSDCSRLRPLCRPSITPSVQGVAKMSESETQGNVS